jgi:hypothetical protein
VIFLKKSKLIIIYVILLLLLFGCGKEKGQQEIKPKDKAPNSLKELSKGIDDILGSLGEIERLMLDIPLPEGEDKKQEKPQQPAGGEQQGGGQGDNEEKQGSESNGDQDQGQEGQQQQQSQAKQQEDPEKKKQEEIKNKWDEIQKKLDEIHPHWNSFEAEGQKKGATKEAGEKFEAALNKMTKAIEVKSIIEVYDYASQSIANLKPFYDLYLDDIGGDLSVLKHSAYQGYIRALIGDLDSAKKVLSDKEENINRIRLKLTDEKEKEKVEKITLALADFRDSLEEDSQMLFMIKKDVVIENIKALE